VKRPGRRGGHGRSAADHRCGATSAARSRRVAAPVSVRVDRGPDPTGRTQSYEFDGSDDHLLVAGSYDGGPGWGIGTGPFTLEASSRIDADATEQLPFLFNLGPTRKAILGFEIDTLAVAPQVPFVDETARYLYVAGETPRRRDP
jgi:hypothetical protein